MKYLLIAIMVVACALIGAENAQATHGLAQFRLGQQQCLHGQQALILQNVGHHGAALVVPQSFGFFQAQRQPVIRLQINGNRGFNRGLFRQGFRQRFGNRQGLRFRLRF